MDKNTIYSDKEELANAVTHGIGLFMAIIGLVVLVWLSLQHGSPSHVVGFSVFGVMMVALYLASTAYHLQKREPSRSIFRKLDHIAIFLLIAGTYTPFCLAFLEGLFGWSILGIVWATTVLGIILKIFYTGKWAMASTILYIAMGWLSVLIIKPIYLQMTAPGFAFLITGGLLYSIGTIFYLQPKVKYHHGIWHLFVLGGSTFHFFSVLSLIN